LQNQVLRVFRSLIVVVKKYLLIFVPKVRTKFHAKTQLPHFSFKTYLKTISETISAATHEIHFKLTFPLRRANRPQKLDEQNWTKLTFFFVNFIFLNELFDGKIGSCSEQKPVNLTFFVNCLIVNSYNCYHIYMQNINIVRDF
jgi:hypothetical protein